MEYAKELFVHHPEYLQQHITLTNRETILKNLSLFYEDFTVDGDIIGWSNVSLTPAPVIPYTEVVSIICKPPFHFTINDLQPSQFHTHQDTMIWIHVL